MQALNLIGKSFYKLLAVSVLSILLSHAANAQLSYGIHAGWLQNKFDSRYLGQFNEEMNSFTGGIQLRYQAFKGFGFLVEASYQRQGREAGNFEIQSPIIDTEFGQAAGMLVVDYLRMPIQCMWTIESDISVFDIGLGVGPGIWLGGNADLVASQRKSETGDLVKYRILGPIQRDQFHLTSVALASTMHFSLRFKTKTKGSFGLRVAFHFDRLRKSNENFRRMNSLGSDVSLAYYLPTKTR